MSDPLTCAAERPFEDEQQAWATAAQAERRSGVPILAEQCDGCGKWHLAVAQRPMTNSGGGWFGVLRQLLWTLEVVGADRDEHGNFLVRGTIASFMGMTSENTDVVVGADAQYCKGDQWAGLAGLLNSTSYGLHNVTVF